MYGRQAAKDRNDYYDYAQANDQSASDIFANAHRGHISTSKTNRLLVKFMCMFHLVYYANSQKEYAKTDQHQTEYLQQRERRQVRRLLRTQMRVSLLPHRIDKVEQQQKMLHCSFR